MKQLIAFGSGLKVLDKAAGKIGGYLVRFGSEDDTDLDGEYFTAETEFGGTSRELPIVFHHGMDAKMGARVLGMGSYKADDVGLWFEGILSLRNEYEEKILALIEAGKAGFSSGAVSHLTERAGKHIKTWVMGEASITPTPAEWRNSVTTIKSLSELMEGIAAAEVTDSVLVDAAEYQEFQAWKQAMGDSAQDEQALQGAEGKTASGDSLEGAVPGATGADGEVPDLADLHLTIKTLNVQKEMKKMNLGGAAIALLAFIALVVLAVFAPQAAFAGALIATGTLAVTEEFVNDVKALVANTAGLVVPTADEIKAIATEAFKEQLPDIKAEFGATNLNLKTGTGDSHVKAFVHYLRTGDASAEMKASNDTDMNIGTNADGGFAVPTGHHGEIIARRDEMSLFSSLGVRNIPGVGTTVNVPIDAEDDGEFISTAEAAANDRDAPALGQKAFTLVKYTKKIEFSNELLHDEESRIMAWVVDFVARGAAKTENNLFVTEAAANGTSLKTFASATAIAGGEPQDMLYNNNLADYLDDSGSVAWITQPATYGKLAQLTGNNFQYAPTPQGNNFGGRPSLLGHPVYFSQKVASMATTNKSLHVGNYNFMGRREGPGFTVLRDPYSAAGTGQVRLHYYFRVVYGVLQAEAIGYGTQA